ncbi:MAG: tol-pal system YbgF family protein [Vampirovibrionia bacterium]
MVTRNLKILFSVLLAFCLQGSVVWANYVSFFSSGKEAFEKKQYSIASHYFNKAIQDNPQSDVSRYYLAITQAYLKQYDKARDNYQYLVDKSKNKKIKELSQRGLTFLPQKRKEADSLTPILINSKIDKSQYSTLTYQTLSQYKYDWRVRNPAPPHIKMLANKKYHIKGYMIPVDGGEYFTRFILVNALPECFFCYPPPVNQVVQVEVVNGKVSYLKNKLLDVYGTLVIGQIDDPFIACVYTIKADMVEVIK